MLVHRSWGERMAVQAPNIQLCPNPKCGADVSLSANNCPKCGTPQRQLLGRGTVLQGRYRIDGIRGCGGFGAVYRATDLQTGETVAIKENHQHRTFSRFEREAKLLMGLSHPNLPKVRDVFTDAETGRAYMVMDFIDGETLQEMVERKGALEWQEAEPIFAQVVTALSHLHQQKIVHRDVKPSNIIVTKRVETVYEEVDDWEHVVLVDFGVAKVLEAVDSNRPRSSSIVAWTDGYSPPEQYQSGVEVDARADQYALAATIVFTLTGQIPDDAFTRMEKFRNGEPTLPPKPADVPDAVWQAIGVAMGFEPNYRFDSVDEFWKAIQGKVQPKPIPKPTISPKASALTKTIGKVVTALLYRLTNRPRPLPTLKGHTDVVHSVSFSPDGQILASGSWDDTIKLWRVSDGSLIGTLEGHTLGVNSVSFSPDGQILASGSWDKTIKLWRVSDGSLIRTLTGHTDYVRSVSFSPDGQILASGSWGEIKLWRVSDGSLIRTLTGHKSYVFSVSFSPDGQILASGSWDDTIRLWRVR